MKVILIVLIGFVLCANSCEKAPLVDKYYRIIATNNSSEPIRIMLANEHSLNQYPDTNLPEIKPILQKIEPGKRAYFDSQTKWQENLAQLPLDTLSVYIIDSQIYDSEPWDSIREKYLILVRYDLGIEDLEATNFEISYP